MINKKNQCTTTRRQAIKILVAGFGASMLPDVKALNVGSKETTHANAFSETTKSLEEIQFPMKFDFGNGTAAAGYKKVSAGTIYSKTVGYGFEPDADGVEIKEVKRNNEILRGDYVTASPLFKFSVSAPQGNYKVAVTFGDAADESSTTVKAETRRLIIENVTTAKGQFETRTFYVNVRDRSLSPGNAVKLDVREWDPATDLPVTFTWDDKLTLQFSGANPCVCAVEIEPVEDAITLFLCGDSTVTDQASEPNGTWGQQLQRWFDLPVVVSNHAESGQTLKAFRFQRRWDKVMEMMKEGDYVFMQFGHNDLNRGGHDAMWPVEDKAGDWINTHSEANTDYVWLLASYAVEIKRRGGIPVIVSPMTKMNRTTGLVNVEGMGDYPKGAAEAAKLAQCDFIDLFAMSVEIVKGLGTELSPQAYTDGLHSSSYGGYLFTRCIVEGVKKAGLGIVQYITKDAGTFDPSNPKPLPADFKIPVDPRIPVPTPPGMQRRTNT